MTIRIWTLTLMLATIMAVPATAAQLTVKEKSAVSALLATGGGLKRLDLSKPQTRAAVEALWRLSGVTPAEASARLAKLGKPAHAVSSSDPDPVFQELGFSGPNWTEVKAHSLVVTGVATSITDVTVTLLDAQQQVIAVGSAGTQNSASPVFAATEAGANPTSGVLTAVTTIYVQYKDGTPATFAYQATGTGLPTQIANLAPVIVNATPAVPRILVCSDKSVNGCDYTIVQSGAPKILLPLRGSVTFAGPIDVDTHGKPAGATAGLFVTGTAGGAVCPLANGKTFFDNKNTTVNGATLSWDFSRADFGPDCYRANATYDLVLSMMVMIDNKPVWAAIASDPSLNAPLGTMASPPFQMLKGYGGVATGTLVTMADNSQKPIEAIAIGDTVKGSVPLTVYATITGTMNQSNTLSVPEASVTTIFEQAVLTQRGALQAQNVLLSDSVVIPAGSLVQLVERSQKRLSAANGVTNLFLAPKNGGTPPSTLGYFAGGLEVLDATVAAP